MTLSWPLLNILHAVKPVEAGLHRPLEFAKTGHREPDSTPF